MYQAGTLSGNPVAMAAGCATLDVLAGDDGFPRAAAAAEALEKLLISEAARAGCPLTVHRAGAMLGAFFQAGPVRDWPSARASDTERFSRWHRALLEHGVYWPPSQFEAAFTSAAHGQHELEHTASALRAAFAA
jgi:glutamate-1-semialdehyde 2,1-aminomutase